MKTSCCIKSLKLLIVSGLLTDSSLAFAASDNGTLSVAHGFVRTPPPPNVCVLSDYGYLDGLYGSYSPTGLTGGGVVFRVDDEYTCSGTYLTTALEIEFASNPGSSWLTSITCNGIEKTGASAAYSFVDGTGFWTWSNTFSLSGKVGSNVSCTIVHN